MTGVTLAVRRDAARAARALGRAPAARRVLDLVGAEHFPDEVAEDMRRFRTRGGSVKVNWILSEPPRYEGARGRERSAAAHEPGASPVDRLPRARLAGRHARRAGGAPVHRGRGAHEPIDPSLTDDGTHGDDDVHPVRARTTRRAGPTARARPTRSAASAVLAALRAQRHRTRSLDYEVLAPPDLERIFGLQWRLDLPGRAGPRPDGVHAPRARCSRATPRRSTASTCAGRGRTRAAA